MPHVTSSGTESSPSLPRGVPRRACPRTLRGFTLFELLLVAAIAAILAAVAYPGYLRYQDNVRIAQAKVDIVGLEAALERYYTERLAYPDTLAQAGVGGKLDPWGNPYQYLNIATAPNPGSVRKDRNLVPINSDYDLYSKGKDGRSQSPLTAQISRDDIIRANNGKFVGLAADY
jgi:general secretion pathway protein G